MASSAVTTPAMEVAVKSRAAAGMARSKGRLGRRLLWGSSLHLKQAALSKAHVLKSPKSVDVKWQETLCGGCLALSPALTFPEAGLNWVSLTKPKCGAGKRCRRTPAGALRGAEGGRAREGVWLELEPSVTQQRGSASVGDVSC